MTQPATMLYRRFGPRRLMIFGMTGALLTNLAFQLTDLQTSLWWIRLIVLLQGSSLVFVFISLQTAGFATIENRDQGHASAIFNAVRQVGSSLGVALAAFVLTNRLTSHNAKLGDTATQSGALSAFHSAFLAGGIIIGLGIIASFFIVDKDAEVTMQSVKEKETQSIPKTSLEPVVDPVTVPADDHPSEENENIEDERLKNSVEIDRKSDTETGII